ncbi:NAD(P)-dependent oxidoreductase [Streptomyces uncialis]|uniref:NAD(P)-dependent oxidoreductase n=1 Tax=Streptomyces uncialis TaxID=1048205 RepID=UPI00382F2F7F
MPTSEITAMTSPDPTPAHVSVIGLGMMGSALATALLKAGHQVTVWNRNPAKTGILTAQGAIPADSPAAAIEASELTILCLTTYDNVTGLLTPIAGSLKGRVLANLTNGTPAQARELAAWTTEQGAAYLDGGIMAVPQMIATPAGYILYSGDERAYEAHRPTLAALGGTRWTGTDPGYAALYDLALLTGMYGMVMGVTQAYAMIRSENIPAADFAPLLEDWVTAMTQGAVPGIAAALDSGDHLTDVSSLAVNQAAIGGFLDAFAAQGVSPAFFEPLRDLLDRSVAEGHSADGFSRLVELLRK